LDCFFEPQVAEELYDVVNDSFQFNNLAGNQNYLNELNEMREILDIWIIDFGDKIPKHPTPDKFNRWTGKRIE